LTHLFPIHDGTKNIFQSTPAFRKIGKSTPDSNDDPILINREPGSISNFFLLIFFMNYPTGDKVSVAIEKKYFAFKLFYCSLIYFRSPIFFSVIIIHPPTSPPQES